MKDKYELKTTERDLELNGDDIGFHCLQRIRHDARLAHELRAALLDAAERCAFLERVAEQAIAAGDLEIVGSGMANAAYSLDEALTRFPDLAAYLRERASDAGQEVNQ